MLLAFLTAGADPGSPLRALFGENKRIGSRWGWGAPAAPLDPPMNLHSQGVKL